MIDFPMQKAETAARRVSRTTIIPLRLPGELADALNAFAQLVSPALPVSSAMRLLLRAGLASHESQPMDLRSAAFAEGWAAGAGEAAETYQRALHDARRSPKSLLRRMPKGDNVARMGRRGRVGDATESTAISGVDIVLPTDD